MKIYYIGMDVHKKIIAYCIKTQMGRCCRCGHRGGQPPCLASMAHTPSSAVDRRDGGDSFLRLDL